MRKKEYACPNGCKLPPRRKQLKEFNDKIINSAGEYFKKELENTITQILNSSGIQVSYISIDINTKGEEFSVDKIYVELKKESSDKIYEAEQLLKSQLSIEAQISVED